MHQSEVGPSNESCVTVNGVECRCLIDSGSSVSTITEEFIQQHPVLSTQPRGESSVVFENSSGSLMTYNGKICLDVEILGRRYEVYRLS